MIGIVLVTHGHLADEFLAAVPRMSSVRRSPSARCASGPMTTWSAAGRDIIDAIPRSTGRRLVLLTDMFGGTPSNLAISIMNEAGVEVIAGVNLPMLVRLAARARIGSRARRAQARDAGRKYIGVASRHLAERGE